MLNDPEIARYITVVSCWTVAANSEICASSIAAGIQEAVYGAARSGALPIRLRAARTERIDARPVDYPPQLEGTMRESGSPSGLQVHNWFSISSVRMHFGVSGHKCPRDIKLARFVSIVRG